MMEEEDLSGLQISYRALFDNLKRLISYKRDIPLQKVDLGKDFFKNDLSII